MATSSDEQRVRALEFDILFGEGISRTGDALDLAVEHGIVQKSGSWYSFGETRLGQGRERTREFLKQNDDLFAEIVYGVRAANGMLPAEEEAGAGESAAS